MKNKKLLLASVTDLRSAKAIAKIIGSKRPNILIEAGVDHKIMMKIRKEAYDDNSVYSTIGGAIIIEDTIFYSKG